MRTSQEQAIRMLIETIGCRDTLVFISRALEEVDYVLTAVAQRQLSSIDGAADLVHSALAPMGYIGEVQLSENLRELEMTLRTQNDRHIVQLLTRSKKLVSKAKKSFEILRVELTATDVDLDPATCTETFR